ncbi:MAG: hypothetical protein ACJAWL_001109 [Motiliproteus sp.]|jgi:hypothetical protein
MAQSCGPFSGWVSSVNNGKCRLPAMLLYDSDHLLADGNQEPKGPDNAATPNWYIAFFKAPERRNKPAMISNEWLPSILIETDQI